MDSSPTQQQHFMSKRVAAHDAWCQALVETKQATGKLRGALTELQKRFPGVSDQEWWQQEWEAVTILTDHVQLSMTELTRWEEL